MSEGIIGKCQMADLPNNSGGLMDFLSRFLLNKHGCNNKLGFVSFMHVLNFFLLIQLLEMGNTFANLTG